MSSDDSSPAALRDQLQAALGASYVVERELGGSGMSRVFLADEPALGRKVVIKVLTPELASEISAERFAREIRLAASLQQANIVPLLSAGSAAGLPYYTMPLVEGRSLRDRIARDGALPVNEGVGILRDLARALAYAHARGVVHRDIKPGNVLLSGGTAVVTDFGIAKALGEAREGDVQSTLTRTGMAIGTPAYMAPEQATGDPGTDHRADLYAFGCVAYEVFAGKPPFQGTAAHEIIAAHFTATPPAVRAARAEVPPAVAELIERCLEKAPDKRPQSAEELLATLDNVNSQPTAPYRASRRRRVPVAGLVAAGVIATGIAIVAIVSRTPTPGPSTPPSLAVGAIPFRNLTSDTALDYLSDGLSDELLTALGKVPGLRISGRQSAYRYKGRTDIDVQAIERELGIRFLIVGTLREGGGQLMLSAQVNDSATQGELWSGNFSRARNAFGAVTDSIARAITDTLQSSFPLQFAVTNPAPAAQGTTNGQAYDTYLLGQEQLKRRAIAQSVASFEQAIALDTGFARAHAALALALSFYPYFLGTSPRAIRDSTISEARRALRLDSTLADAYTALGATYGHAAEWDSSDAAFQRATRLGRDDFETYQTWARFLIERGRVADALRQLDLAQNLERTSALISAWRGYAFFFEGRKDSALAQMERARQIDSTHLAVQNLGATMYLALGMNEDARQIMSRSPPPEMMTVAPYVQAKLGDTATANRLVRAMETMSPRPWFADGERALVLIATGDTAAALNLLERSDRDSGPMWIMGPVPAGDPAYDPVRQSPRFADLLRRANVDVAPLTTLRSRPRR